MTNWLSQYPLLASKNIAGYGNIYPNNSLNGTYYGGFQGKFSLPALSPSNTTTSIAKAINTTIPYIEAAWSGQFQYEVFPATYPSSYDLWSKTDGPDVADLDIIGGSRLFDTEALSRNLAALKTALKSFIPSEVGAYGQANLVSGKGVWDVVPRGGSDAVNPAWRKAVVHMATAVGWAALDFKAQAEQTKSLTNKYWMHYAF